MKTSIDSSVLAALVAGFTLAVQHTAVDLAENLAPTGHTINDVQQNLADLQKTATSELDAGLLSQINTLLGTPDPSGAGKGPAAKPAPVPTISGQAPACGG